MSALRQLRQRSICLVSVRIEKQQYSYDFPWDSRLAGEVHIICIRALKGSVAVETGDYLKVEILDGEIIGGAVGVDGEGCAEGICGKYCKNER